MSKLSLVFGAIALGVGCGANNTYHCDFRMAENQEDRCQERSNDIPGGGSVAAESFKATCEAALGDGGDGPCSMTGAIAGCDYGQQGGEVVTDWYYEPMTMEDAERDCVGGTLITP